MMCSKLLPSPAWQTTFTATRVVFAPVVISSCLNGGKGLSLPLLVFRGTKLFVVNLGRLEAALAIGTQDYQVCPVLLARR